MTVVEAVLVLGVFLMLLFGLFEYCRFLLVLHVTNNAARDGARYAVVNVNCPSDQVATKQTEILNYTTTRMGGVQKNIIGYKVAVYPCDPSGFTMNPPQVIPKSAVTGTTVDPFQPYNASTNPLPPWNQATFTERIAVTIKGQYKPITPTFLLMPDLIDINVTAVMGSEG
jgi:hypothetical protein